MDRRPNVVIFAVDTLRADHLGCYGYERDTSPNIDSLAKQGAVAERFMCAGLPTQPSFTTLYTGQHPITHGIVAHGGQAQLSREAPFLPQLLLAENYTTCGVDNLAQTRPWFGRGYEYYIDPSVRHPLALDVSCEELNARVIPWLRAHRDEQFFMLIHYWDPHWPLVPPARYRDLFYRGNPTDQNNHALDGWWEHPLGALARDTWLRRADGLVTDPAYVEALYDQEIRHLDDGIGEVLGVLDELELADDTLVIFLGDHGESMTEHGIYFTHHGLYDATLRVPFIARLPGQISEGRRLQPHLQHHDVAPTILEAVNSVPPIEMDGESFWDLLRGGDQGGRSRAFSCECTWQAKWCIRTATHKFILSREVDLYGTPECELYDLVADPGEARNVVAEYPEIASQLEDELESWIAARLAELGKDEDPLTEHGVSLGRVELG